MKKVYDAIIVGAGHNGLVASNYLSQANKKVLVLEQRQVVGGAAVTEELLPGFQFSRCSYVLSLFRQKILSQLKLYQKGLKIHYRTISSLTPTKESDTYLLLYNDAERTLTQISKFSRKDANNWKRYVSYLQGYCDLWNKNLDSIPYNFLHLPTFKDRINFAMNMFMPNLDYFGLGNFMTCSVEEMLDNWFQSDILKSTLATDGIIGENLSISDRSTAYVLLHHVMGELQKGKPGQWGYVEGGNGRLSQILADSARNFGAEIRLNSKVTQILCDGQTKGVKLQSGEFIQSKQILSNCTNRVTFFELMKNSKQVLPIWIYNKIKNTQYNGAATKLNIVLTQLPKFKAFKNVPLKPEQLLQGTIHLNCQTMDKLKLAFKQTKSSRISKTPFMDITIPSTVDKTLCPEGYYIMNCFLQYTPYHPNYQDGAKQISHQLIKQTFIYQINQYLQEPLKIHFMDILTPHDLEKLINLTEGNIFHGSIGIENIFTNRISGKVGGVWLCGSSAHPGGGVMGAVGRQVSLRILAEKLI